VKLEFDAFATLAILIMKDVLSMSDKERQELKDSFKDFDDSNSVYWKDVNVLGKSLNQLTKRVGGAIAEFLETNYTNINIST